MSFLYCRIIVLIIKNVKIQNILSQNYTIYSNWLLEYCLFFEGLKVVDISARFKEKVGLFLRKRGSSI
jgi:hypothetical protein